MTSHFTLLLYNYYFKIKELLIII